MDARHRPLTLIALAGLGSCSSASYVDSADEEVARFMAYTLRGPGRTAPPAGLTEGTDVP